MVNGPASQTAKATTASDMEGRSRNAPDLRQFLREPLAGLGVSGVLAEGEMQDPPRGRTIARERQPTRAVDGGLVPFPGPR